MVFSLIMKVKQMFSFHLPPHRDKDDINIIMAIYNLNI